MGHPAHSWRPRSLTSQLCLETERSWAGPQTCSGWAVVRADPQTLGSRAPEEPQDRKRVTASPPELVLQGRNTPTCLSSSLGVSRLKDKTSVKFLIVQTKGLLRLKAAYSDELSLKLKPHTSHQCGPRTKSQVGQVAPLPLEQGEELQESIFFSQLKPEKPPGQRQVYPPSGLSEHRPPLKQGPSAYTMALSSQTLP